MTTLPPSPPTQVRGWRAHLSVTPPLPDGVTAMLTKLPGLTTSTVGTAQHFEVPIHGWAVIEGYLRSYFAQAPHHNIYFTLGWPKSKFRGHVTSRKMFPPGLDPRQIPGLNERARTTMGEHQVDALRRLFARGASLEEIPTGGGKTLIAIAAAAGALALGWKVLIVAPSSTNQWAAELQKWMLPEAIGGMAVLGGQFGCEVRAYKGRTQEWLVPLVTREEAEARLPKRAKLGKLVGLWEYEAGIPASDVPKAQRDRAVDLGIVEVRSIVLSTPRWVVWDNDAGCEVATFPEGYSTLVADEKGTRTVGPAEAAEGMIKQLNAELRVDASVVIVSAGIVTNRRQALRKWAPDLVIFDEFHEYKASDRWKMTPAAQPGMKPTFHLSETQAASAWWVAEMASAVLGLTATPDPDRRRDLWSLYDILDTRAWGNFRSFTERYCAGRNREIRPGQIIWDSTGEVKRGVPLPMDPSLDAELRQRAAYLHHITPRAVSHKNIPAINRQLVWLEPKELSRPGKDSEWEVPVRTLEDQLNRLLDVAAEMKRPAAISRYAPWVLDGQRGVVLTGSHASCDRLGAAFLKRLGGRDFTVTRSYAKRLNEVYEAIESALGGKCPRLTDGQVVQPLVISAHGGDGDRDQRYEVLQRILRHPGPALLIGTTHAWGQGWDGMQFMDFGACLRLGWNQGKVLQAEGRFERQGGIFSVLFEYLLARGTVDDRLLRTVLGKSETSLRLFERDDLERMRAGLAQEESQEDMLRTMLAGLIGDDLPSAPDEDDFDVTRTVEEAVARGNDRE